jgi:hypothetical protein
MSPASSTLVSRPTDSKAEGHTAWSITRFLPLVRVPAQVSTKSSTEKSWRPPGRVFYTDHDAFSKSWLERRAKYQLRMKLNAEIIQKAGRTANHLKHKIKASSREKVETKLLLRQKFFWLVGIFEHLYHWIFINLFWVSAQVSTKTSTNTPWRPARYVIPFNDPPDQVWLEPHAKEQLRNKVNAEVEHRVDHKLNHLKLKTNLFMRQKLDWLLGIFVHLYRERFLTLFIIGASGLLFWSGYALLACLITGIWLWVSFAWSAWTTRKDETPQKYEESSIKKNHGTITYSYPSSPNCPSSPDSPSSLDCQSSPDSPLSPESPSSHESSSLHQSLSFPEGPLSPDCSPVLCVQKQAINRTIVPATLPVPENYPQVIIPPGVREFVYFCNNHSGEPYNHLPNEECGNEPWSIFTLHNRCESQISGPPIIHEWRETSRGELEHVLQGEDLSMSPEGEEHVVMEDNFDKDWTLVAEGRKEAQVAAEEDEQSEDYSAEAA